MGGNNMDKAIKVVAINTPYQVVLNVGRDDGISASDRFIVFGLGQMITDPDSGEPLEQLEIPRGRGKVIHLQNKICTIESTEITDTPTTIKRTNKLTSSFAMMFPDTETSEIRREKQPFDEVQLGDQARKI
jgi:hypothetical protein